MNQHIEDYLKGLHAKNYHGTDDDMPDAYDAWLTELQADDWINILTTFEKQIREGEQTALKEGWGNILAYGKELTKFADKIDAVTQAQLNILNERYKAISTSDTLEDNKGV